METQVQWLLGANYTGLTETERPLECIQEPGDVVLRIAIEMPPFPLFFLLKMQR